MAQLHEELFAIADRLDGVSASAADPAVTKRLDALEKAATKVGKAWGNSWLGYQACVYYEDLNSPPPGAHFSQEWGTELMPFRGGTTGDWCEFDWDFIEDRLKLPVDEFNRVPIAGITNIARLSEMLDAAAVALMVLTAEDEQADGSSNPRMNVVHEAGLFQGRLGFTKAIVLLEEGCAEFSNIQGLGQIRFPKGNIKAAFEEVRQVLEREGLVKTS